MRISRETRQQWLTGGEAAPLTAGLIPERDYTHINEQNSELRLWLPEQAKQALTEVCERRDVSMTGYLTEFFAAYLFGVHELMRMQDGQYGLYEPVELRRGCACVFGAADEEEQEDEPDFDDPVPEMGKNIFSLKLFLPIQIKEGLQQRAGVAKVSLGKFARAMICAHLFGRAVGANTLLKG